MALSAKLPVMVGASSVALGGVAYSGYRYFSSKEKVTNSFSKYSEAFLNPSGDESLWNAKLLALKSGSVASEFEELKNAKKGNSLPLLKQACQKFYSPNFVSKNEKDFEDFKNYCSKSNKDVVGTGWVIDFSTSEKAEKVINKIKERGEVVISQSLMSIETKHKNNAKTDAAKTDLNRWCKDTGESVYLGENSLDLKTGKEYCKDPG